MNMNEKIYYKPDEKSPIYDSVNLLNTIFKRHNYSFRVEFSSSGSIEGYITNSFPYVAFCHNEKDIEAYIKRYFSQPVDFLNYSMNETPNIDVVSKFEITNYPVSDKQNDSKNMLCIEGLVYNYSVTLGEIGKAMVQNRINYFMNVFILDLAQRFETL